MPFKFNIVSPPNFSGSYDNEGIAIFCMLFTYTLWIKSVKTGSVFWSILCSLAYFYMVSILFYQLKSLVFFFKPSSSLNKFLLIVKRFAHIVY